MSIIGLSYTDPAILLTVAVDRTSFALWHVVFAGTPAHAAGVRRFLDSNPDDLIPVIMVRGLDHLADLEEALRTVSRMPGSLVVFDSPDRFGPQGIRVLDAEEVSEGRWEEARIDLVELNDLLAIPGGHVVAMTAPEQDFLPVVDAAAEDEENLDGPRFVKRTRRHQRPASGDVVADFAPAELEQRAAAATPVTCPCEDFNAEEGTLGYLLHAVVHDMADIPDAVLATMVNWAVGEADGAEFFAKARLPALRLGAPEDALAALGWYRERHLAGTVIPDADRELLQSLQGAR
jgi:hypothetical protein